MDELDERLEAALPTRTGNELTALTADLAGAADPPLAAAPRARNLARIDHSRGNVTRTGRWVVPRRLEIRLTRGRAKLDFTDADVTGDSVHLDVDLDRGGDLILVIRPGILVDVADLTVSRSNVRIRDRAGCQAPEFSA